TIHNWVNRGTEDCIIAFVLISARPVKAGTSSLEAVGYTASVWLYSRCFNGIAHQFDLLAEVSRRFCDTPVVGNIAVPLHGRCNSGRLQCRPNSRVQLFNDLRGRPGRSEEHAPRPDRLKTREHVLHERHVGECRKRLYTLLWKGGNAGLV